ncbi:MAG TPA: hypothetical protein VLX92_31570, partial [Kofleriaceae bacterium]|nr:hypothetical protein [Kofleriaceae bacterium]
MARWALFLASLAWLGASDAGTAGPRTAITVWAAPFGGTSYAAAVPGATITEQRELDVGSGGDARAIGVAATIDPASVQLRDLTEPGATVRAQRFVPGATTPDEILARHVGDTIAVVTAKGELSGVLRAVDAQSLVLELGTGDQRHLQVLRREVVTDVRLPPGTTIDRPTLIWQLASKLPGRHTVELGYRADGMTWTADYLAVLDDKTLDFSAWATVRNATGASFGDAQLTLVTAAPHAAAASGPPRPVVPPQRFAIATPVRLGAGETVQVELVPPRTGAHPRRVVVFEPMPDPSGNFQAYPSTDCNQLSQSQPG